LMELERTSKSRGFYVRMKIPHRSHNKQDKIKSFCYRYFKWVLWVLLSLYFFASHLITSSQNPKVSVSNPKHSLHSNVLFETNTTRSRTSSPNVSAELNGLKIYVYDLPSKYNSDWLSNERCSNHLFAAEVAIHRALLSSDVRTLDPFEADFFFVPVYVSCNFSTVNGFSAIGHARPLMASAVQIISSEMPFWNKSSGSDHVFVASHDFGACFHTLEDVAIKDGIPEFLKKSIILQTFGVKFRHPCQDVENVLIPPYIRPRSIQSTMEMFPINGKRDIGVFFRGKMEVHPKNVSGRFYGKGIRTVIWHKYSRSPEFYLKRHRFPGYQTEIARSTFCLCPLGWAPWSPRLVESVALGCIPVIIADGIRLPYSSTVRWEDISLTVAEKDIHKLVQVLQHVSATNLSEIQRNLWDPVNRQSLLFNEHIQRGDATWQILVSLSQKLHLSYNRRSTMISS
ncbi:hypothetical protein GIB67_000340, partial [Kingdonia uniflora]